MGKKIVGPEFKIAGWPVINQLGICPYNYNRNMLWILLTFFKGEYKCENSGICIGLDKICDGTVDCPDNEEDEWVTFMCPSDKLTWVSTQG